jgi:hypothetical protein
MSVAVHDREVPWRPLQLGALVAGGAGLAVWALGWLLAVATGDAALHTKVFFSYLFAFAFCLAIPLGSMAIWMIHNQTGGAWGLTIHRVLEAATRTVPFMAILFLPVLLGLDRLYYWADPSQVREDFARAHAAETEAAKPGDPPPHLHAAYQERLQELIGEKRPYLNVPWFLIRAAIYFGGWSLVAVVLSRGWIALEREPDTARARRLQVFSGPGFLLYGLGMTFAAIDWLMSLEPDWYSTIYGMLVASGQMIPALGFVIAATAWLAPHRPLASESLASESLAHAPVAPEQWNDLGNLLLASVMFWAYLSISQWLLIWSGNLQEEIPWYWRRSRGGWEYVAWLLGICYFALPFLMLLSRRLKRDRRWLMAIGAGLVAVSVVHHFWLVNPVYAARMAGRYETNGPLSVHWLDLAALVGVGGVTFAIFLWQLRMRPLVPAPSPFAAEPEVAQHA